MNALPEYDGIYYDVPEEDYHSDHTRVSKGQIDRVHNGTPYEYQWSLSHPTEPSAAMRIGSLAHACILQPSLWASQYVVAPQGDKRTKAYKETLAVFEAQSIGKTVVDPDEYALVCAMRDTLPKFQPKVKELIDHGATEVTVLWTDETTGVKCKCRPDCMTGPASACVVVDLKTSDDISPETWAKKVDSFRYHVQQAWYTEGLRANGITVAAWVWALACRNEPYMWAMRSLPQHAVDLGWCAAQADLSTIARCRESNEWPGYPMRVEEVDLPAYVYKR